VKLTYMPFITRAAVQALRKHPIVNASMQGESILYNKNINIGIAVALEWGLIVPVIKQAEEKSFLGIARAVVDLADRARSKKLAPDDVAAAPLPSPIPASSASNSACPSSRNHSRQSSELAALAKKP